MNLSLKMRIRLNHLHNRLKLKNSMKNSAATDHSPGETFDPDVKTMSSLEEGLRNLATNYGPENVYAELPALDLKKVIVSNEEIHQRCADEWMGTHPSAFEEVDPEFMSSN